MPNKPEPMTEEELLAIVGDHIQQAAGFLGDRLSEQRSEALRYYFAEPFGDEIDGRSQYISTDVADTIEWMLPQLLEPFVSGESVVRFTAVGPEDQEASEQETDYINHVFLQDNPGFMLLYTWFKDGLLSKKGFVKAWVESHESVQEERYEGLTAEQVAILTADPEVEIVAATENMDGTDVVWDAEVKRTSARKRIRVKEIPPEHFLIDRRALTIAEAMFVGHRERQNESELILEGHDPELVRNLPDLDADWSAERQRRFSYDDQYPYTADAPAGEKSTREIWTTECYIRADWDGDGIAELRRVKVAGTFGTSTNTGETGATLLINEHWPHERAPIYDICPQPITHKFFGQSIADLVMDIQHVRSTLIRQMLDATYLSTSPRMGIDEYKADIDDALVHRAGSLIRVKGSPHEALFPLPTQPPDQTTYTLLELLTAEKETRTGITRYNQGLNAGSLNKTASGINQILSQSQLRIKLIARIFAEGGVTELFRGLHELVRKYQDVPRTIRLRGKWVDIDPSDWRERMDSYVEVGIGAANRDLQLLHLDSLALAQSQIVQAQGGLDGPLVTWRELYNTMSKRSELASYKEPDLFARNPSDPANAVKPKEPQPDPKMIEIQVEAQQAAMELQQKGATDQAKLRQDAEETTAKLQLEYEKLASDTREAQAGLMAKMQLEREKLALQRQEHEDEQVIALAKLELERAKIASDRESHDLDVIGKQLERAQTEHATRVAEKDATRARGEVSTAETTAQRALEELKSENLRSQSELLQRQTELAGMVRTKKAVVHRGKDGKMSSATITEGSA